MWRLWGTGWRTGSASCSHHLPDKISRAAVFFNRRHQISSLLISTHLLLFFFCSSDSNFSFYLSNVLIYVDQIAFSSGVPESKLTFLKNSHKELNEPYKLHTLAIVWARLLHLCIACSTRVLVQSTWATSARLECSQLCKKQWTLTYVEPHISPGCLRVGRIIFPLGVPMNCAFLKCIWLEKCNCDVLQHFST